MQEPTRLPKGSSGSCFRNNFVSESGFGPDQKYWGWGKGPSLVVLGGADQTVRLSAPKSQRI